MSHLFDQLLGVFRLLHQVLTATLLPPAWTDKIMAWWIFATAWSLSRWFSAHILVNKYGFEILKWWAEIHSRSLHLQLTNELSWRWDQYLFDLSANFLSFLPLLVLVNLDIQLEVGPDESLVLQLLEVVWPPFQRPSCLIFTFSCLTLPAPALCIWRILGGTRWATSSTSFWKSSRLLHQVLTDTATL